MNSQKHPNRKMGQNPDRLLVVGGGDFACKALPTLNEILATGTEVHVADVVDGPKLLAMGFKPTAFYNISHPDQFRRLLQVGAKDPFDIAYVSSLPSAHFDNILMLRAIASRIIVTKPSTDFAHYGAMETLIGDPMHEWFLETLDEHDHVLTKPGVMAVRDVLAQALADCGRFRRMRVFLTEQKAIMEEEGRLDALRVGQLSDMGSHGIALVQSFTPEGANWIRTKDGLEVTRLRRTIKPTACIEFQANGAIALGPHGSSAAIAELQVEENLRVKYGLREEETYNIFNVLLVCGKSLTVDPAADVDLKAVEVEFFDGTTGALDVERNSVRGIFHTLLGSAGVPDRQHRGINLGIRQLITNWGSFIGDPSQKLRRTLFQQRQQLWEKLSLLWHSWRLAGEGERLVGIADHRPIQDLVNTYAVPENGFRTGWRMRTAPSDLIFGTLPSQQVK